jgi:hypothetical protein
MGNQTLLANEDKLFALSRGGNVYQTSIMTPGMGWTG